MFQGVKNQMLVKMQVEKFISSQYVKLIYEVVKSLEDENKSKNDICCDLLIIAESIIKKYNLNVKDLNNEK